MAVGSEVSTGGLQSCHLHDCVPAGGEGGDGDGAGQHTRCAHQQVSAEGACDGQGGYRLPHRAAAEPEGGRRWAQVCAECLRHAPCKRYPTLSADAFCSFAELLPICAPCQPSFPRWR